MPYFSPKTAENTANSTAVAVSDAVLIQNVIRSGSRNGYSLINLANIRQRRIFWRILYWVTISNHAGNRAVPDFCPIFRIDRAAVYKGFTCFYAYFMSGVHDIPMSENVHFFVTKSDLDCAILKPSRKGTQKVLRRWDQWEVKHNQADDWSCLVQPFPPSKFYLNLSFSQN